MHLNAFDEFDFVLRQIMCRNYNYLVTRIDDAFRQVIWADRSTFLGSIEMLVEDQNFHDAKKTKDAGSQSGHPNDCNHFEWFSYLVVGSKRLWKLKSY